MNGGEEVVFTVIQYIVVNGYARRYQFGDTAFHQFLGELRVFQLVANGYALARTYQLGRYVSSAWWGKPAISIVFPLPLARLVKVMPNISEARTASVE